MPKPGGYLEKALRKRREEQALSVAEMKRILAREREPGLLRKVTEGGLGLLGKVGTALDYATGARAVRYALGGTDPETGETVSGRRLLEKAGVLGPNKPGLDLGDVGGFVGEVALDPLSYLGGVGVLTRGAKAAQATRAGKIATTGLRTELQAARRAGDVARRADVARRLERAEKSLAASEKAAGGLQLAEGIGAQARAGQRYLLKGKVPFGPEFGIVRGAPVLEAAGRIGTRLAETAPVRGLRRIFSTRYGRVPETEPLYARFGQAARQADVDFLQRLGQGTAATGKVAQELGVPAARAGAEITQAAEKLGVPERLTALLKGEQAAIRARADKALEAAKAEALKAFAERKKTLIEKIKDQSLKRAKTLEGRAYVAERLGRKAEAVALRKEIPRALWRAEFRGRKIQAQTELPKSITSQIAKKEARLRAAVEKRVAKRQLRIEKLAEEEKLLQKLPPQ